MGDAADDVNRLMEHQEYQDLRQGQFLVSGDYEEKRRQRDACARIQRKLTATKLAERKDMNLHHLITMLQKNYTTVHVEFKADTTAYTYKAPLSMELKEGDMVLVPVQRVNLDELKFLAASVKTVDAEPDIDVNAPYSLKWVVQKLDFKPWHEQMEREEAAVAMLKKQQRRKAQEEALETLLGGTSREELLLLLNGG